MSKKNNKSQAVDELWEQARAGTKKLTATDRRRCLVYIDDIGDTKYSYPELARIFGVSETVVRADRKRLMSTLTGLLTPEHAIHFVSTHIAQIDQLIAIARRGLNSQNPGDLGESRYMDTLTKLLKEKRDTLMDCGVIRKELGNMSVTEERWEATVTDTGECFVGPAAPKAQDAK